MSRKYFAVFLVALFCLALSLKVSGQLTTVDDGEILCDNSLPTAEQVADIIRQGVEKVIASSQPQQSACAPPGSVEVSKHALVSALVSNCIPLLIHHSVDGSNFFNRSWAEFKVGFNDSRGNYWLGNDLLHELTREGRYKLRCLVQARSNSIVYVAIYDTFLVGDESSHYTLTVSGYSGNAGDSMSYHNGMKFSTYDRENDLVQNVYWEHCAQFLGGGFWYNACFRAGMTVTTGRGAGFSWYGLPASVGKQMKSASMWLIC